MAQLLGQQALQPVEVPQQAGVRASPYMGLAKMLQGYMAGSEEKAATQAYKDLAQRQSTETTQDYSKLLEAMRPQPAIAERPQQLDVQEQQQMADQGSPMPPNMPAQAAKGFGLAPNFDMRQFKNPEIAKMAMAQQLTQLQSQAELERKKNEPRVLSAGQGVYASDGTVIIPPTYAPKERTGELAVYDEYVKQQNALGKKPLGINEFQIEQRKASRPLAPPRERVVFDATRGGTINLDTGAFTPVTQNGEPIGLKPKELRPVPATINTAMTQNQAVLNKLDRAEEMLNVNPNATGILKGITPNIILNRTDKEGTAARAALADLAATKVHDLSGAAVSVSEFARLKPFLPQPTDDAETIKTKLFNMKTEIQDIMSATNQIYSEEQGYKPIPNLAPSKANMPPASALKEGQTTTFANGQKWTLQGGKPLQVK